MLKDNFEIEQKIKYEDYTQLMDRLEVIAANLHEHCFCHPVSENDKQINNELLNVIDFVFDTVQFVAFKRYEFENANKNESNLPK